MEIQDDTANFSAQDEGQTGLARPGGEPEPSRPTVPCTGRAADIEDSSQEGVEGSGEEATSAASPGIRRALKLVVTLHPTAENRFQALLAVGAEGCDPLVRSAEVEDLVDALGALVGLVEEAEEQWREHSRYPTAQRARPNSSPGGRSRELSSRRGDVPPAASTGGQGEPGAAPKAAGGQLKLFG